MADLFHTEEGADGRPQTVLPGAERLSTKEALERRAAAPMRAQAAQDFSPLFQPLAEETPDLFADEEEEFDRCTNPGGHEFECSGTAYGGDDERWHGEGRCLCIWCGADGDG